MSSTIVWLEEPGRGLVKSARPGQIRMASYVAKVAEEKGVAVIQAGTGTGKSLGALVPVVASDKVKRIIYSTGKKTLQAQVMHDLHNVCEKVKPRLFGKRLGKGNYVCQLRLTEFLAAGNTRFDADQIQRFASWVGTTSYDEIAEFGEPIPFDYAIRVNECLKHQCPQRKECGFLTSLADARAAEVLVVNHALLAFDLSTGGGKILGAYDMVIIDEAHQAPEAFRSAYTLRWHPAQARFIENGMRVDARLHFPQDLHEIYEEIGSRLDDERPGRAQILGTPFEELFQETHARVADIKAQFINFGLWSEGAEESEDDGEEERELSPEEARERARVRATAANVARLEKLCKVLLSEPTTQYDPVTLDALPVTAEGIEYLTYISRVFGKDDGSELNVTPIEIGPLVAPALRKVGRVVLTSATIATGRDLNTCFEYTLREFGLFDRDLVAKDIVASPFDYKQCSVLYVDRDAPLKPDTYSSNKADAKAAMDEWYDDMGARMHELLEASRGGAFILCASREDLEGFADALRQYESASYRVGVQEKSDDGAVKWFKEDRTSVLLGLKALWEGVDVPGMGLRMIIVPRLPFPNRGDTLLTARKERYEKRLRRQGVDDTKIGYQTFTAFDVNIAARELAQGFGRLIRRQGDMGIGVCLDPRLVTKAYGGILRSSIPLPLQDKHDKTRILNLARTFAQGALRGTGAQ